MHVEKSEACLRRVFNIFGLHLFEYNRRTSPVNLKIDIDTYEDIETVIKQVLDDVAIHLSKYGCSFDENDLFIYRSKDKIIDGKIKHSIHINIRDKNWCFASKSDILEFIKKHDIANVDIKVYHDRLFRCPFANKPTEDRQVLPLRWPSWVKSPTSTKDTEFNFKLFKYGLMGYIEPLQKTNIIKLVSDEKRQAVHKTLKAKCTKAFINADDTEIFYNVRCEYI